MRAFQAEKQKMDISPPGGPPATDPQRLSERDDPPAGLIGHVDPVEHDRISGWAFDPSHPGERVSIEVLDEERRICTVEADVFRRDLLEAGIGDGRHGFSLTLPMELFAAPAVMLRFRVIRSGMDLIGSPVRVRNLSSMIDEESLGTLSQVIRRTVRSAQTSNDLHGLASWLIEHFDVVYQRQTSLAESLQARRREFSSLIGENRNLSNILRQASEAVVAKYATLTLDSVERPTVSVIIPVFGSFDYTYRCLASIVEHLPAASIEVLVVDDASTDETIYAALVLSAGIRLIRNRHNLGFARSSMIGAEAARGEFLLFLNNDTEVQAGWLDELVGTLERDPTVGIAGSKLLYPDGRLQEAGGIIWRQASGWNWGRQLDANDPRFCFLRDADYVSGASLMIRKALFEEVGGFSPEFAPAYYEDTDLCFKVRQSGRRVVVQPASRIVHHEGVSAGVDVDGLGMKRFQRINQRVFLDKWFDVLQNHYLSGTDPQRASERIVQRRVLFIDDTVPTPDCDAGSNAALEHMKSLQRIGYKVNFVGSDNMAKISPYTEFLERLGVQNYYAPYFWSVEEIFRREIFRFDLFYIHRMMNVIKYAPMIRQRFPGVRIIFNVADLHHLRLEREASITGDPGIAEAARAAKETELAAITEADAIIVHSSYERDLLSRIAPGATVHVIPWAVRSTPSNAPFRTRSGIAFVGGYNHTPNVDAARWLVREVMPLVHAKDPDIECALIGSHMPDAVRRLERPGVRVLGHVPDLSSVLQRLRLTVAPLRYGAGLKGKVLTSLAAGLPCVATPCAVEGMGLPGTMDAMIASSAVDFATEILRLHENESHNAFMAAEGRKFIEERCSEAVIDGLMLQAAAVPIKDDVRPSRGKPQLAAENDRIGQQRHKTAPASKQQRAGASGDRLFKQAE